MGTTIRHQLPLLVAGQAQKEVTHNEAVQGIDRLLHPSVKSRLLGAPPAVAAVGDGWIVGGQASGPWAGMTDAIAVFDGFGWAFMAPRPGLVTWIEDEQAMAVWQGEWSNGWPAQGFQIASATTVPLPVGGSTVDVELRQSFAALLSAFQQLGLLV